MLRGKKASCGISLDFKIIKFIVSVASDGGNQGFFVGANEVRINTFVETLCAEQNNLDFRRLILL